MFAVLYFTMRLVWVLSQCDDATMNQFTHSFYFFQNQLSNGKKDEITGDGGVDLSGEYRVV